MFDPFPPHIDVCCICGTFTTLKVSIFVTNVSLKERLKK